MNNELKINRLLRYEVTFQDAFGGSLTDTFTADEHDTDNIGITTFCRTGNVVREYLNHSVSKIVVTPVEELDDYNIPF